SGPRRAAGPAGAAALAGPHRPGTQDVDEVARTAGTFRGRREHGGPCLAAGACTAFDQLECPAPPDPLDRADEAPPPAGACNILRSRELSRRTGQVARSPRESPHGLPAAQPHRRRLPDSSPV